MSYYEAKEYEICDLRKKKHLICSLTALIDSRSVWEEYDRVLSYETGRKIKSNLSDKNIENIKIRDGVEKLINTAQSNGITLSMVTELLESDLAEIIIRNREMREFRIFKIFNGGVVTNDSNSPKQNLFAQALRMNGHSRENTLALTNLLDEAQSAKISARIQTVAIHTEENMHDSDYISKLVDCYYMDIEEFTIKLKDSHKN